MAEIKTQPVASITELLEYIKKQKNKIKRLQLEIESAHLLNCNFPSTSQNADIDATFWGLISQKPTLIQKLARSALLNVQNLFKLYKYRLSLHPISLRYAFIHWRAIWKDDCAKKNLTLLEQAQITTTLLEQRVFKLKTLLTRTHQNNQKNIEEFSNLKREKQEVAEELRNTEIKSNEELIFLREEVRENSVFSAFRYDVDALIQQAVDCMLSKQDYLAHVAVVDSSQNDICDENSRLKRSCDAMESVIVSLNDEIAKIKNEILDKEVICDEIHRKYEALSDAHEHVKSRLKDEECQRHELDIELQSILSCRLNEKLIFPDKIYKNLNPMNLDSYRNHISQLDEEIKKFKESIRGLPASARESPTGMIIFMQDWIKRLLQNLILEIFPSKLDKCVIKTIPVLVDYLSEASAAFNTELIALLDRMNLFNLEDIFLKDMEAINFKIEPNKIFTLLLLEPPLQSNLLLNWMYSGIGAENIVLSLNSNESSGHRLCSTLSIINGKSVYSGAFDISSTHNAVTIQIFNSSDLEDLHLDYRFCLQYDSKIRQNYCSLLLEKKKKEFCLGIISKIVSVANEFELLADKILGESSVSFDNGHILRCEKKLDFLSTEFFQKINSVEDLDNMYSLSNQLKNKIDDGRTLQNSAQFLQSENSCDFDLLETSIFSTESLIVNASDDFRIFLPPLQGKFRISWQYKLLSSGNIGFAIGNRQSNGSLPLLVPYSRTQDNSDKEIAGFKFFYSDSPVDLVILFDNTYSWITNKCLRYRITVDTFRHSDYRVSKNIDDSLHFDISGKELINRDLKPNEKSPDDRMHRLETMFADLLDVYNLKNFFSEIIIH